MKKIFILFTFVFILLPLNCFSLQYPELNSKSVMVYDRTDDKILYSYNNEEKKSIASLTKIVTTIVSIEKIDNLDEQITIDYNIISSVDPVASKAGLKIGDVVTYRDLLYASILPSGADATNALAISLSGSIDGFVNDMNSFASKVGANNTNFVNVTGLDDENHYSSVNDVLKILNYALDNKLFYEVFTTKKYTLSNGLDVYSTLYKYHGDDVVQIKGSKTGFTGDAGYCIATLSDADGHDIISIFLDAEHIDNIYYNIVDSITLIDYVKNNYSNVLLLKKNSDITILPVELCDDDEYIISSQSDVYKFLPSDYDINLFRFEYSGINKLNYNNKKGDKLGEINYYYDDEFILKEDVFLTKNLKMNFLKLLKKYLVYELIFLFFIIFIVVLLICNMRKKLCRENFC